MKNFLPVFLIAAFAVLSLPVLAQDQGFKISVQGTLKDPNGLAVDDGPQNITFRLYTAAQGGDVVHEETADVQVRGGVYSYLLGSNAPLQPEDFNTTLYLSLEINNNELFPRTEMTYSPYSLSVSTAQQSIRLLSGSETCSGSVGDIKYSILTPDQFEEENGDCWVPMDGRDIAGTKLADNYGWNTVPDMSGLFIRATEYNDGNDPGRSPMTGVTLQDDETKSHNHYVDLVTSTNGAHSHTVLDRYQSFESNGWTDGGADYALYSETTNTTSTDGNHNHTVQGNSNSSGGAESRPKNMNFYVYIRVD
ncbi:MAG: hypothetical protein NXI25_07380 [bacterium]|nr:hypothetical protein [bacterium]